MLCLYSSKNWHRQLQLLNFMCCISWAAILQGKMTKLSVCCTVFSWPSLLNTFQWLHPFILQIYTNNLLLRVPIKTQTPFQAPSSIPFLLCYRGNWPQVTKYFSNPANFGLHHQPQPPANPLTSLLPRWNIQNEKKRAKIKTPFPLNSWNDV